MVGSHLAACLARAGYTDIVLPVRNPSRLSILRKTFALTDTPYDESVLRISVAELTDRKALSAVMAGADAVFNCAAKVTTSASGASELIANNVTIARSVAECALGAGVRRFIHVSSIATLGNPRAGEKYIDEECPAENPSDYSPYGQSKQAAEAEIWLAARKGLGVTVVLPGVILGEGDYGGSGSSALIPLLAKGLPITTSGVVGYVDVRDVARAMVALYEDDSSVGQKFVLSAANLSYKELMALGAKAAGRPKPILAVGRGAMMAAYGVSEFLRLTRIVDTGLTKMAARSATDRDFYDGSKIERAVRFEYTPPKQTVDRIVGNYLKEKKR